MISAYRYRIPQRDAYVIHFSGVGRVNSKTRQALHCDTFLNGKPFRNLNSWPWKTSDRQKPCINIPEGGNGG